MPEIFHRDWSVDRMPIIISNKYQSSNPIIQYRPLQTNHPISGPRSGPARPRRSRCKRLGIFQRNGGSWSIYRYEFISNLWILEVLICCFGMVPLLDVVYFIQENACGCGFDGCTNICQRYLTLPTSLPSSEVTCCSPFQQPACQLSANFMLVQQSFLHQALIWDIYCLDSELTQLPWKCR